MKNSTAGALAAGTLVAGLVLGSLGIAYGVNGQAVASQPSKSVAAASVRSLDATTTLATPSGGSVDPTSAPRPADPSPHRASPTAHHVAHHARAMHQAHHAEASSMHRDAAAHSGAGGCND